MNGKKIDCPPGENSIAFSPHADDYHKMKAESHIPNSSGTLYGPYSNIVSSSGISAMFNGAIIPASLQIPTFRHGSRMVE
jgi:hypothetical protein